MRILLLSQQSSRRHAIPAYTFWEHDFKAGLAESVHEILEVTNVDWAEGLTAMCPETRPCWFADTWDRTLEKIYAEVARIHGPLSFLLNLQSSLCPHRDQLHCSDPTAAVETAIHRAIRHLPLRLHEVAT